MGCGKFVGRVGALAVALGIGTALAPPAWAETPDTSAAGSAGHPSTDADTPARSDRPADSAEPDADNDSGTEAEPAAETEPDAESDDDSARPSSRKRAKRSPNDSAERRLDRAERRRDRAATRDTAPAVSAVDDAPPVKIAFRQPRTSHRPAQPEPLERGRVAPSAPATRIESAAPTTSVTITAAAAPRTAPSTPPVTPPGDSPLLLGLLAFSRRELQRTYFNRTPRAVADVVTTSEQVPARIPVLDNDTDRDGDVLAVATFTQPRHGTVTVNPDRTLTYTPDDGFTGVDTFTYTATDQSSTPHYHGLLGRLLGIGHTSKTTVTVTVDNVNRPPVANPGSVQNVSENSTTTASLANLVSDPDGDTLTLEVVAQPALGTVTFITATGFRYVAPADIGTATSTTFTYRAFDGSAYSAPATVTINFVAANQPPVAADPAYSVTGTDPRTGAVTGSVHVVDTNALTYTVTAPPDAALGSATLTNNGGFVFTPTAAARLKAYTGTGPATAQFTITAGDGQYTVAVPVTVSLDPAEAALTRVFTAGESPSGIAVNGDGSRLYVTNYSKATVTVVDAATLTVIDTRPMTTAINGINVGPNPTGALTNGNRLYVANTGSNGGFGTVSVVNTDTSTEIAVINVGNSPQHLALNGTRLYVVNVNDNSVSVIDTASNTVVDTITLTDAPRGITVTGNRLYASNFTTDKVTVIDTSTLSVVGELTAGTDPYGVVAVGDRLYVSNITDGTVSVINAATGAKITDLTVGAGAAFLAAQGDRVYVSNAFDDSVSVIDTTTNTVVETVAVAGLPGRLAVSPDGHHIYVISADNTVSEITSVAPAPANRPPVANPGSVQNVSENSTTTASLANLVSDPDGDTLTLEVVAQPALGTVTFITATGFRYVAPADIGTATSTTFTYRAFDGSAYSNTATVTIAFVTPNEAPMATDDTASVDEDSAIAVSVLGNDSDPDGDALTVTAVGTAAHGSVSLGAGGVVTYTPEANYFGEDSFTYTVSDGALNDTATVTVTVDPVEDAPVIQSVQSRAVDSYTWIVTVTAFDPDGTTPDVTLTADDPTRVTVTPIAAGLRNFARAFAVTESAPTSVDFEVVITDTAWALANPGALVGVTAGADDGTSAAALSDVTVGAVINVVGVGNNGRGQLDLPAPPAGVYYTTIATDAHTVALRSDGTVVAVGGPNENGELDIPPLPDGITYTDVAVGVGYTVLLRSDGSVVSFGNNDLGENDIPPLPDGLTYTHIGANSEYTVLVRSDGEVLRVGDLDNLASFDFPALPTGVSYTDVAVGQYGVLLLRSDGKVVGADDNTFFYDPIPDPPAGVEYTAIAAGLAHAVLVRSDGKAIGLGYNYFGQATPPPLPAGVTYTGVAAGGYYSVLLRSDGTAVAFGLDAPDIPDLPAGARYVDVFSGGASTFLLTSTNVQSA